MLAAALLVGAAACSVQDDPRPGPGESSAAVETPGAVRPTHRRVLFADATAEGDEADNTTFATLLALIEGTPVGETIRIVAHSFSYVPVAEALVGAHERGVDVQVITDRGISGGWRATAALREVLGTDRRARSFVYLAPGDLHQKTWSFTRAWGLSDVVLVGSMNLTYVSARQYSDVVPYIGEERIRRAFDRRFGHLLRDLPDARPFGPVTLGPDTAYFLPGPSGSEDPVFDAIEALDPSAARIQIAMYAWLDDRGLALARLLAEKAAQGARVDIVLGPSIGPRVLGILRDSEITLHPGVFDDGTEIHHKLTIVEPARGRAYVFTGSDNYTQKSLGRPELLLRLTGDRRVASYREHFDELLARG